MSSFIGYRVTEREISDWLSKHGYKGKSAKFAEVELHAIQRPGWLQIFRFELTVLDSNGLSVQLFGAVRADERYGPPHISVYPETAARDEQLAEWSEGLITQRRHRS